MPVARVPTVAPFPTDPVLTGIVLAYKNSSLIADDVLPRVPVGGQEFRYLKYSKPEGFTLPDTKVSRRGRPNTTEYGATEDVAKCEGYALDAQIPRQDIDNAASMPGNYNPVNHHVMVNRELIALGREKRVADKVFAAATYPVGNKETLAAGTRWSQATGTPIADIEDAKDAMIVRPNIMVLGRKTWRYLKTHPTIVKALNRNEGDVGIADRRAVAELFELDEILVGEAWLNTAKPGQAAAFSRVWGPHAALLHRNRNANTQGLITFGYTGQWGTPIAGQWEDRNIGISGGINARVGEFVGEVVAASDLGYFFENAGDDA